MKKIAVFGCKSTTIFIIEAIINKGLQIEYVITISPETEEKNQVADYENLKSYCELQNIKCYQAKNYNLKSEEDKNFFIQNKLDIGFVMGWQRLIPKEILETFSTGVFGMHGSADNLPIGRGRSPMNWALIEQRKHFFTNIFKYDPGVDSGDILDTFVFSIQPTDTSETMHFKNSLAMKTLINKNINNLLNGEIFLKKQKDLDPTYYPKRSPQDSLIDWQKDIFQLDAFIRAVTYPFNGAFSFLNEKKLTIWRAAIFETDLVDYGFREVEWGKIVEVFPNGKFLINCRGGLLIVHEYETESEIQINKLLESKFEDVNQFKLNKFGYHDLKPE